MLRDALSVIGRFFLLCFYAALAIGGVVLWIATA